MHLKWLEIAALVFSFISGNAARMPYSNECQRQLNTSVMNCSHLEWTSFNDTNIPRNISLLDISANHLMLLRANMFVNLNNLKTINLKNNEIFQIDVNAFRGLNLLTEVFLSKNELTFIPPKMLRGNGNITKLWLNENKISIPFEGPFLISQSLTSLYMSFCKIRELINADAFSELPNLRTLSLSGNDLHNVRVEPFLPLKASLGKVSLLGYSVLCSSELRKVISELQTHNINYENDCNNTSTTPINTITTLNNTALEIGFTSASQLGDWLPITDSQFATELDNWLLVTDPPSTSNAQSDTLVIVSVSMSSGVTCFFIVVLVVFVCYKKNRSCKNKKHDNDNIYWRPSVVRLDAKKRYQDQENGGYEIPVDVSNFSSALPLPEREYLTILHDDRKLNTCAGECNRNVELSLNVEDERFEHGVSRMYFGKRTLIPNVYVCSSPQNATSTGIYEEVNHFNSVKPNTYSSTAPLIHICEDYTMKFPQQQQFVSTTPHCSNISQGRSQLKNVHVPKLTPTCQVWEQCNTTKPENSRKLPLIPSRSQNQYQYSKLEHIYEELN